MKYRIVIETDDEAAARRMYGLLRRAKNMLAGKGSPVTVKLLRKKAS